MEEGLYLTLKEKIIKISYLNQKIQQLRCQMSMSMSMSMSILRSLHWLPVHYRIVFKILLLTCKALNGLAQDDIRDLLKYSDSRRTLRSSSNRLLDEPRENLKTYGERAFSVAAPRLWNKLPLQIRLSSSEAVFKANLKSYLFKRAFDL